MKAAVYHGQRDIRVESVEAPVIGPGEVLLEVRVAGVCGTDAAEFALGPRALPITDRHPWSGHLGPMIPGHEFAGVVVEVGPDVAGLQVGDWVVTGAGVWCGECDRCRAGRTNLCVRYWTLGLQRDGGLAQLCAVPARTCVPTAGYGLEGDVLGLAQPMAIAVHSMRRGRSAPGETTLVVGVGGIGAFLVHALAQSGLRVIVSDLDPVRRQVALELGAEEAVDPREDSLAGVVVGRGLDPAVVFEVTGTTAGLAAALEAMPSAARLVLVGLHEEPRRIDLRRLTLGEHELIGTNAHACLDDLPEALRLLAARRRDWRDVAPEAIPLERLVDDALVPLVEHRSERIKTLIDPWAVAVRETRMTAGGHALPQPAQEP